MPCQCTAWAWSSSSLLPLRVTSGGSPAIFDDFGRARSPLCVHRSVAPVKGCVGWVQPCSMHGRTAGQAMSGRWDVTRGEVVQERNFDVSDFIPGLSEECICIFIGKIHSKCTKVYVFVQNGSTTNVCPALVCPLSVGCTQRGDPSKQKKLPKQ
jgi:hypothetical protein